MKTLSFTIHGLPKPAGSKRAFAIRKGGVPTGKIAVSDACKGSRDWKVTVSHAAAEAMNGSELFSGPVSVRFTFFMPRPKCHLNSKGEIKPSAPAFPITRPDVLKLSRAVEDALTGLVWHDDSQIADEHLIKRFAQSAPMCAVEVFEMVP